MHFKRWLEHVSFTKDTVEGGRAKAIIAFSELPPERVVKALRNALDKQGMEVQGNLLKFYQPSNHVNDVVFDIAKQILHRQGYERFDDVWHSKEDADELFGIDNEFST